jgi:hypothetical protein
MEAMVEMMVVRKLGQKGKVDLSRLANQNWQPHGQAFHRPSNQASSHGLIPENPPG